MDCIVKSDEQENHVKHETELKFRIVTNYSP